MNLPKTTTFSLPRFALTSLFVFGAALDASAATLSVGPTKTFPAPCAAIAVARDGDTIEIEGNTTYSGDTCVIARHNLTIRGVNGRPKIDAAGKNAKDKGVYVVTGNDLTVDNLEIFGSVVMSGNGAAFRLEGTNFTLRNSFLHDNQNGILANQNVNSNILIEFSEFGRNGAGDGQTHNLYIGHVKSLTFRYNFSHDANVGHNLKSRAETNTIVYNRFSSLNPGEVGSTGPGRPSYEINLPNAGTSYIIGNIIQQPALYENATMVAYGEEGASNLKQDLYVINNTFVNDGPGGVALFVSGHVSTPALIQNNIFANISTVSTQVASIQKSNFRSSAPGFVNRAQYDLHPDGSFMAINAATDPGVSATGVPLMPVAQYKHIANGEARPAVGALDIGAYEVTGNAAATTSVIWTECAKEKGTCTFTGTREVRFGANGNYSYRTVTGSTPCTNALFGDPAYLTVKSCSYSSTTVSIPSAGTVPTVPGPTTPTWTLCSMENNVCSFWGTREIRFGANGKFITKVFTNAVKCDTKTFGEPILNVYKSCSFSSVEVKPNATTGGSTSSTSSPATSTPPVTSTTPTTPTTTTPTTTTPTTPTTSTPTTTPPATTPATTWTTCAVENNTCTFSGTRKVRYGAGNKYVIKVYTKTVKCSNTNFGDPIYGTVKSCGYSSDTQ